MWFESLLILILFKFKKNSNISGIRVVKKKNVFMQNKKNVNLSILALNACFCDQWAFQNVICFINSHNKYNFVACNRSL